VGRTQKTKPKPCSIPMIFANRHLFFHRSATQFYATKDAPNKLNSIPLPPAPAVKTEGVVSLEDMLKGRGIVYDFGAISPTRREGLAKDSGRVLKDTLLEMEDLFDKLLQDPGDFWLKLRFSVVRLKLNNIVVERLLRDFLKRCDLHMKLLGKAEEAANDSEKKLEYYGALPFRRSRYF
jgi:hypothetical protein